MDLTEKVSPMAMHQHMSIPLDDVKLEMSGAEVEFILRTLTHVHSGLLYTIRDKRANQEERKAAYDFALGTEQVYASIFNQLKLHKPERTDLN